MYDWGDLICQEGPQALQRRPGQAGQEPHEEAAAKGQQGPREAHNEAKGNFKEILSISFYQKLEEYT